MGAEPLREVVKFEPGFRVLVTCWDGMVRYLLITPIAFELHKFEDIANKDFDATNGNCAKSHRKSIIGTYSPDVSTSVPDGSCAGMSLVAISRVPVAGWVRCGWSIVRHTLPMVRIHILDLPGNGVDSVRKRQTGHRSGNSRSPGGSWCCATGSRRFDHHSRARLGPSSVTLDSRIRLLCWWPHSGTDNLHLRCHCNLCQCPKQFHTLHYTTTTQVFIIYKSILAVYITQCAQIFSGSLAIQSLVPKSRPIAWKFEEITDMVGYCHRYAWDAKYIASSNWIENKLGQAINDCSVDQKTDVPEARRRKHHTWDNDDDDGSYLSFSRAQAVQLTIGKSDRKRRDRLPLHCMQIHSFSYPATSNFEIHAASGAVTSAVWTSGTDFNRG